MGPGFAGRGAVRLNLWDCQVGIIETSGSRAQTGAVYYVPYVACEIRGKEVIGGVLFPRITHGEDRESLWCCPGKKRPTDEAKGTCIVRVEKVGDF